MDVQYQPTAQDWHELLGVGPVVREVFAGETTITHALDELEAARGRWPGTAEDWVAVVDATIEQVQRLHAVSNAQLAAMTALEDSLGQAIGGEDEIGYQPPDLPHPVDRILTADELALLGHVHEWFSEIVKAHERNAEDAEQEAEEADADYEQAEQDLEAALAGDDGGDDGAADDWGDGE